MINVDSTSEPGVARLTLARPTEGNTLNLDTAHALKSGVAKAVDSDARVLLLDATGKLFCGGGDVRAMSTADDPVAYTHELAMTLHEALLRIAESDLLFVCAVQGAAAGAGFSIVLNADYVIAGDRASFVTAYLSLGVTPDGGGSYLLPRVVGKLRASELLLGGRRLDAVAAKEWGVANEVAASDDLEGRSVEVARSFASLPAAAAARTKRLLGDGWIDGYREHLDREAASISELIGSSESRARQDQFLGG